MSKHFRLWAIDQQLLLPPSVQDFVPEGHVSRFILGLVRDSLDLGAIAASYTSGLGQPPFDPAMMTALLLNGYVSGLYSSRRIARACVERADFMMIAAGDPPDFRTIADFRKRHLAALAALFLQVLELCAAAGLAKLGHVAFDGTKIKANASKHKAMSYAHMKKREAELQTEVNRWLAAAETADTEEDAKFGRKKRGDEMPDWVADKQKRIAKIAAAKTALEAEAKAAAEEERRIEAEKQQQREAEGRKKPGKPGAPRSTEPDPKSQKNFTDPESRVMKSKEGFVQAYNAQIAVDADAQIIVACDLTQNCGDQGQLVPMVASVELNMGRKPDQASADAGYCSEANLQAMADRAIDAYIAPGRAKHATANNGKTGGPLTQAMRKKIDDGGFDTPYRLRKQIVEPVFGQIKQARGFRQFLLRGVEKVRAEWAMICTAHNLRKLFKHATIATAA
jgi:transposase